jgi:hypothetical protein
MFVWWQAVTVGFACVGAFFVANRLRGNRSYTIATGFALATTWIAFVSTWTLFENAFLFEALAILPLFAVVLAGPVAASDRGREKMALIGAALLMLFVGVRAAKIARAAVTWSGRDPAPLTAFVRSHVPAGSEVIGPEQDYYFAVEESGSRYLIASQVSASDWARWMGVIDGRPAPAVKPLTADYMLWPDDPAVSVSPPVTLPCLSATPIASYEPPAPDFPALAALVTDDPRARYPRTVLYKLKWSCDGGKPAN